MSPKRIAEYEIIDELGRGSTAHVFLATKEGSNYAIKVFDRFISELNFSAHKQEFSLLKKLDHPSIVRVHDYGTADGYSFIVMDFVPGLDMAKLVHLRGSLPTRFVIQIVKGIVGALEYARKLGVVHGDIKPSNIIVGDDGEARLVDFGIARITPSWEVTPVHPSGSREPTSFGTTDFMAPEVLNDGSATWSSDLYSLGVVTYFGLCARLPSDGRTTFTRSKDRIEGKLVPLSSRNPLVSVGIETAIHKVLSSDPKDRYDSPEQFCAAIISSENSHPSVKNLLEAKQDSPNKIDIYRYIVIPIIVAVIGAIAAVGKLFF